MPRWPPTPGAGRGDTAILGDRLLADPAEAVGCRVPDIEPTGMEKAARVALEIIAASSFERMNDRLSWMMLAKITGEPVLFTALGRKRFYVFCARLSPAPVSAGRPRASLKPGSARR